MKNIATQNIQISFANPEKVRARKVVSRSNAKSTGKYPSWKMNRMMHWESVHELHAFMLLDADPEVRSFNEQPCLIRYLLDGEIHRHYPDILVTTDQGQELWEVKPKTEAEHPDIVRRTTILSLLLPEQGYVYRMVHAESLAVEPQLQNIRRLLRLGRSSVDFMIHERFRLLFRRSKTITWSKLCVPELDNGRQAARLILEGALAFAFDQPLMDQTLICRSPKNGDKS